MNGLIEKLPKGTRWWVIVGLILFAYFLLRQIPATWGGYALTRGSGLALSGVTGSFWSGKAALASVNLEKGPLSLGQLSWQLKPLSLLTLKPCVHLVTRLDRQVFDGDICVGSKGAVAITSAEFSFPAELIQDKLPIPVSGQFMAHLEQLDLRGNVLLKLSGKLTWSDAQVNNGATWMDIGNYGADLTDNGNNGVKAKVFQLSGPIDVDLNVELKAPAGGQIQGELALHKSFVVASRASGLLSMLGQEKETDADGKTHYQVDMPL